MEKANFKLFGVEITVVSTPSSEYSSIPTVHHDNQNNNNNVAANNYDVLTTLSSSATNQNPCSEVSRKSPAAKKRAFDEIHDCNNNHINVCNINLLPFKKRFSFKKRLSATIFPSAAQVGGTRGANINGQIFSTETLLTTVQLSTDGRPCADDDVVSRESPAAKKQCFDKIQDSTSSPPSTSSDGAILDNTKVYSPEPLRCYFPPTGMIFSPSELGSSRNIKPCKEKKKKEKSIEKNKAAKPNENKKKKKKKEKSLAKSRGTFDKSTVLPLEEIPGLMEIIGSQNGSITKPVFLYKKELVQSDVEPHLNRLFVAGNDKELTEFLTEEEKAAVIDKTRGLEFVGIDKEGESYNLRMKNWGSLTIIAINKEWTTMVKANNGQKGDWVELWGYRVNMNNEFRLVVSFRKSETGSSSSSSTITTTNVDGITILPSP